jgi:carbonic anhydrase/acetyltransferase-like protein (isoleucine patch superfamily)
MGHPLRWLLAKLAFIFPGGATVRPTLHRWRGVRIGRNVWIAPYVYLDELYPEGVRIGDNCTIGLRTSVFSHFHWGSRPTSGGFKPVVIEDDVFIGPHCVVLPGVLIGQGSVIRAGSVVTRNVPPGVFWSDAGGGPLMTATVPLTPRYSYEEFVRGLRPLRSSKTAASRTTNLARSAEAAELDEHRS